MFTLEQLEEDASLLLDLKEEVREECETLGEVTNVVLYDVSIPGSLRIPVPYICPGVTTHAAICECANAPT